MTNYFLKRVFRWMVTEGYKKSAAIIKNIFKKSSKNIQKEKYEKNSRIIVEKSGPMAHIYFTFKKERLLKEEIESVYGNRTTIAAKHEGVEFAIFKTKSGYEIVGKNGEVFLDENFKIKEEKGELFKNIVEMDMEKILLSLKEVAEGDESGDIIIFGAVTGKNRILNFEEQYGAHGGIGGMQNFPFLISKEEIKEEELTISKFYNLFNRERDE